MITANYHIRFRHIPLNLMFTPMYLIPIDHITLESKKDSTEYELKVSVCNELNMLGYNPDDIKIESFQQLLP